MSERPKTYTVTFHLGKDKADFEDVPPTTTVAALKPIALEKLMIVEDPNIDYLLNYQGVLVANENQTLDALTGGHISHVNFDVEKRPKGG